MGEAAALLQYLQIRDVRRDLETWLVQRKYSDVSATDFALNEDTLRIGNPYELDAAVIERRPLAVLVAVPRSPRGQVFKNSETAIWDWLNDKNARRYPPDPSSYYLTTRTRPMLGGAMLEKAGGSPECKIKEYFTVHSSGIVEQALSDRIYRGGNNGQIFYHVTALVGLTWQFIGFVLDLYRSFGQAAPFSFLLCIRTTRGSWLNAVAPGWAEPGRGFDLETSACRTTNVRVRRDNLTPGMDAAQTEALVRELAVDLDNAWGLPGPRSFVNPSRDPAAPFAADLFQQFSRA